MADDGPRTTGGAGGSKVPTGNADGGAPNDPYEPHHVGPWGIAGLALYSILFAVATFVGIWKFTPDCSDWATRLAEAAFPTGGASPQPPSASPQPTATASSGSATSPDPLTITSVSPDIGAVFGETLVTIEGRGLAAANLVRFGGTTARAIMHRDGRLVVSAPPHALGKTDVTVAAVAGPSGESTATLVNAFTFVCPPPGEHALILLVLFAGALGATVHGLRSLFWYVGNRELVRSWSLMYIILPFNGAALALVFFLIVRGGFYSPNSQGEGYLVLIAISALVGAFSQQAMLKLKSVADALLTAPGEGKDAKPQAARANGGTPSQVSITIDPKTGPAAGGTTVQIMAPNAGDIVAVSFAGKPASIESQSPTAVAVKTPPHTLKTTDAPESVDVELTYAKRSKDVLPKAYTYV